METTKEKQPPIQNLVTIDEYAVLVDKTKRTIYNWINEKRLPTYEKFGVTLLNRFDRLKD
jgi:predicted DNA-binding transcriptional regulator AlpA